MTTKTERIAIRVSKATKSKLERMAKEENRSMSNYIENIIIQNLEEKEMTNKSIFLVIEEAKPGKDGDTYIEKYEDLEEANNFAEYSWGNMTPIEKKERMITVIELPEKDYNEIINDETEEYYFDRMVENENAWNSERQEIRDSLVFKNLMNTYANEDGTNDLEFKTPYGKHIIRNAKVYLDESVPKDSEEYEFYWDYEDNVKRAVEEANEDFI